MQPKWPMAPMSKICPAGTAREPSWPWQVWGVGWRPSLLETKMKEKEERSYVLQIFRLEAIAIGCGECWCVVPDPSCEGKDGLDMAVPIDWVSHNIRK